MFWGLVGVFDEQGLMIICLRSDFCDFGLEVIEDVKNWALQFDVHTNVNK